MTTMALNPCAHCGHDRDLHGDRSVSPCGVDTHRERQYLVSPRAYKCACPGFKAC